MQFIYRVYRFRACILNSYDTLWLRNTIIPRIFRGSRSNRRLRSSLIGLRWGWSATIWWCERVITVPYSSRAEGILSEITVDGYTGRQKARHFWEIPPFTVRNLCAPLSAHTIAHARLPCAGRVGANRRGGVPLWPWFAQSKPLFRDCLRKNDAVRNEPGPCRSLYRDHESRVRSSFLHRILSRSDGILAFEKPLVWIAFCRAFRARGREQPPVHRFKRQRGTRIESGINCFLCTAKEAS